MANSPDTTKPWILSHDTIERLMPNVTRTVSDIEALYPPRGLAATAAVTRVAPSPTGFMHLGTLYVSLISERIAHQSDGIFYLRVEDTDRKREVEGAGDYIVDALQQFNITTDEGAGKDGNEYGHYGPYTQSKREDIYRAYVKHMLATGNAYPCFMSPEELESMTHTQQAQKLRTGYYGTWAKWRDRPEPDVIDALNKGLPYVIRYRSTGDVTKRRTIHDAARGVLELPESDNDIVILKRDGLPTYHLAHAIDDALMHTTLVIRGDEWLPSVTLHIQLCETLGYTPFTYAHIAPLQKTEGSSRRKLSKRKDPEASVSYYVERGYPPAALISYLLNQANSSYEAWRENNPTASDMEFPLSVTNLSRSGALFSLGKLDSMSADYIARLPAEDLYILIAEWAKAYDPTFYTAFTKDKAYSVDVLTIERGGEQPRKDMKHLSEAPELYGYFFDDVYSTLTIDQVTQEKLSRVTPEDRKKIVESFLTVYDPLDTNEQWFEKVKQVGEPLGFTPIMKEYRKHPELYKGSVADVAMVLRVGLTKRNQSPSLHEVMRTMGVSRVSRRLIAFAD